MQLFQRVDFRKLSFPRKRESIATGLDSRFRGNDTFGIGTITIILLCLILSACTTDTIQPTGSIHLRFNYKSGRPSADSLFPVFPNPFDRANGDTTIAIQFALKDSGRATVLIQNVLGDAIAGYTDSTLSPGIYTGFWNPRGPDSTLVRSGLYFVTLHAGDFVNSRLVNIEENE